MTGSSVCDVLIQEYNLLDSLNYNAVFADEEAIRSLGAALANMSQLCKLK